MEKMILWHEKALLSIGRVPDLEGIGEIDLELENGKVKVDKIYGN